MKYLDFDWDVRKEKIVLDQAINLDKLEWKAGDLFELRNINGTAELVKLDPVVKFIKGYK
jgi:hypothetical protein